MGIGTDFSSHGRIRGDLTTFQAIGDFSVERGGYLHLSQDELDIDIGIGQSQGVGTMSSNGPHSWGVEVHVDLQLYTRNQELVQMEHFQVRFHSHGDSLSTQKLNSGFHQGFLFLAQGSIIGMRCSNVKLVGRVFVGVPIVGYIQAIVPPFGGHDRTAIISIMVQSCFYERFVMVGIGLWADECPAQSHIDLSEEGMR